MSRAYYNEFDAKAAAWLRELIKAGVIADGDVDERSIEDIRPNDLDGYTQCHFFAGIGGWSYALRLAGWPDDRSVWTGSCPCQPFSAAGKGLGTKDERHLWPEFLRLIALCRPSVVFGEQVASKAGRAWLATVRADVEDLGYALGSADLCAAGIEAPHIRQRLYFVADASRSETSGRNAADLSEVAGRSAVVGVADAEHAERRTLRVDREDGCDRPDTGRQEAHRESGTCGEVRELADDDGSRRGTWRPGEAGDGRDTPRLESSGLRDAGELGDSDDSRSQGQQFGRDSAGERTVGSSSVAVRMADNRLQRRRQVGEDAGRSGKGSPAQGLDERSLHRSPWDGADWIYCRDGKYRPVEPGTFPLAHGVPARVGRLRGYGNAIVPQLAAEFIQAYEESR